MKRATPDSESRTLPVSAQTHSPTLEQFQVTEEENDPTVELAVRARLEILLPSFMESSGVPLSRAVSKSAFKGDWECQPLLDGEKFLVVLDPVLAAQHGAVFGLSIDSLVPSICRLNDCGPLIGFCAASGSCILEGVFVYHGKLEEFVLVVSDALLFGQTLLAKTSSMRRAVAQSFVSFVNDDKSRSTSIPFRVEMQRYFPHPSKLLPLVLYHEPSMSRVLVDGDARWPVLGIRFTPRDSPYLMGVSERIFDWYYARQAPLFVACVAGADPNQPLQFYFFGNVWAGRLVLNPDHMQSVGDALLASEGRQCVLKLVYEPTKSYWHVRATLDIRHRTSTPAESIAILLHNTEAMSKEELVACFPKIK